MDAVPVKATEIAKQIYGITYQRYMQLANEGAVPKPIKGYVDFVLATKAFCEYQQQLIKGRGGSGREAEELRKLKAQADREEMKAAKERGDLIERPMVADEFTRRVYTLKTDLLALPRRLTRWPEAKGIVDKALRQMMKNYSKPTGVLKDAKTA